MHIIIILQSRISVLEQSVKSYILNYLRHGTAVGIVSFQSVVNVLAEMTEITSPIVKQQLANKAPSSTNGGTGIGAGLQECHRVSSVYYMLAVSNCKKINYFLMLD